MGWGLIRTMMIMVTCSFALGCGGVEPEDEEAISESSLRARYAYCKCIATKSTWADCESWGADLQLGTSVCDIGDTNGDGLDDVLVGIPLP